MPVQVCELSISGESGFCGVRADRCVQMMVGGSRSFVTGLFDHDCVTLNRQLETDPGRKLAEGDLVTVRYEPGRRYSPRRRPEKSRNRGFTVVYEDRSLIVVDKSAELLTVPTDAREPHTLIYRVAEHVRHQHHRGGAFVVHRLDRGVSGLLVFGKTRQSAERLQQQFAERKPERQYEAIVAGLIQPDQGEFRSFLATAKNLTRFSTPNPHDGELAITRFQVLERIAAPGASVTHVSVQLDTGRRNQIRVHFAEAGHPVIGDQRYRQELWKSVVWGHKRLALHAATLSFQHPESNEPLTFRSTLPREMMVLLRNNARMPRRQRME